MSVRPLVNISVGCVYPMLLKCLKATLAKRFSQSERRSCQSSQSCSRDQPIVIQFRRTGQRDQLQVFPAFGAVKSFLFSVVLIQFHCKFTQLLFNNCSVVIFCNRGDSLNNVWFCFYAVKAKQLFKIEIVNRSTSRTNQNKSTTFIQEKKLIKDCFNVKKKLEMP